MKPQNTASPGCSFSFYPYIGQRQWWSEGPECVCRCTVPLSPTYIKCTSHPACCCVFDTKHLQQKHCSIRLKEHLVWSAPFYAWVPRSQSCPMLIALTLLPCCLPQLRWEWATDTRSLKFGTLLLQNSLPRFVLQLTSKA